MPTAPIDDKGNYVYYEDSGVPQDSLEYTTVIIVHGYSVNGAIFRRMLPYASKFGLRIFTMNMRDYNGSSPYSDEEFAAIASPDIEVQASAVRRLGRDVAGFATYVCKTQDVPRLRVDGERKSGGVALMTWSKSNIASLAILGDPQTLEGESKEILPLYLRKAILYDSPSNVFGVYPQIGLHFPLVSAEIPLEQKPDAFAHWISAWYKPLPAGVPINEETIRGCHLLSRIPPLLSTLTDEEYDTVLEPSVLTRSGRLMMISEKILQNNLRRALLDADTALPGVDVVALWCDKSIWLCVWAAKVLEEVHKETSADGGRKRLLRIMRLEDANHFLHWVEPERMVGTLREVI